MPASPSTSPDAMAQLAIGERGIHRIAGFFGDAAKAAVLARRLVRDGDLVADAVQVLGPADAGFMRWWSVRTAWRQQLANEAAGAAHRPAAEGERKVWAAVIGGVGAGLFAWATTLLEPSATGIDALQALFVGVLWGAILGALLVSMWHYDPRGRRFERALRGELRGGAHAVVAIGVPRAAQAGIVSLVRAGSDRWCADAPRSKIEVRTVDAPPPRRARRDRPHQGLLARKGIAREMGR